MVMQGWGPLATTFKVKRKDASCPAQSALTEVRRGSALAQSSLREVSPANRIQAQEGGLKRSWAHAQLGAEGGLGCCGRVVGLGACCWSPLGSRSPLVATANSPLPRHVPHPVRVRQLGSTAIGIQTSEGVCLAVEKRITSPLMEPSSIEKIVEIDAHIGCAMSGLIADAKTLIDKARVETQNHWFTYNETMTVESVTQAVSNLALQFGEEDADPGAMSRPFGVALLFGGVDEKGPQLFHMDPSGTFVQCDARAIGSASEGAQSSLQEVYHKSMTLKEAIKSSLIILKQVMEEKLNATNIELATVQPGQNFHMFTKEELEEVIKDI
ncbi:Proteasome subunit alpha type-5 [Sciurus carolinensis]|nr:Proteasome subunit alpha type-5 [Sciurus carolinensis]